MWPCCDLDPAKPRDTQQRRHKPSPQVDPRIEADPRKLASKMRCDRLDALGYVIRMRNLEPK